MTWHSFFSGSANVARVILLIIVNILMFTFKMFFSAVKFLLSFVMFFSL